MRWVSLQMKQALMGVLLCLALASTSVPGQSASRSPEPGKSQADAIGRLKALATPTAEIRPYLGTWMVSELYRSSPEAEAVPVERYLLVIWWKGKPRFKTYDYYPKLGARSRESDWKGKIQVDRWNRTTHVFKLKPDGTISLSFSGTNGVGAATETNFWWAYGTVSIMEQDGKPFLHMVTTRGYAPSS
ncbi:MAG: hypothetical protein ACE5ID_08795, partial [Acidobacteriota bacterium]